MYRRKSDCWVWSPGPHSYYHLQHSGSNPSQTLNHQEANEKAEQDLVYQRATDCDEIISQLTGAQRSDYKPPAHMENHTPMGLMEHNPTAYCLQHPVIEANEGEILQNFVESCCWESPIIEAHRCLSVCEQSEQEDLEQCWAQSPFIYYGALRNVVIGVEVVEEVAIEDTLEIITGDPYADDQREFEVLEEEQIYPT